jgi:nitrite reductase/ring-hydroxylating ferredoxin subunit
VWPLGRAAFYSLLAGIVTALIAAVFGIVDYTSIRDDHPAKKTATAHMILNLVAVGIFAVDAGLRFSSLHEPTTPLVPLLLSLGGVVVLSYSGYLGGVLVYDDGIAVGRHRRSTPLPDATIVVKTDGKPTAIGQASQLGDGETWRVSVDGVVATVVKLGGEVYAFQEFCTHRYGPLSEGKFANCEVTCPWHGSRFDIRTGKVTAGPAKVDLRTFRVEIRDAQIWIYPPA